MWIKSQQSPADDPRFSDLTPSAQVLWMSALVNAIRHGTGGHVPYSWVSPYDDYYAAELCRSGIWLYGDGAFVIVDFDEWFAMRGPERRKPITVEMRSELFRREGLACGICGNEVSPKDYHIDHLIPLSRGGPDDIDNMQITHPYCNLSKGNSV